MEGFWWCKMVALGELECYFYHDTTVKIKLWDDDWKSWANLTLMQPDFRVWDSQRFVV